MNISIRPMLVIICLVIFAAGIAALPNTMRRASAQNAQDKSKNLPSLPTVTPPTGTDDKEEGDADLPPRLRGRIDKDTYLSLRHRYTSLLRGIDLDAKAIDPLMRASAFERMAGQELENAVGVSGTTWTEIGPFPLPNGQTQQFPSTTAVTGRATALVIDPTNSNKVYLGTAQGGVWRSTNGGTTWVPIFDNAQSLSIGALALAPSNPTILYVGTGEPNNSVDSFFGVGLYRIDNADTTANLAGPINPQITTGTTTALTYNCFTGRAISRILVHPTDPATIFVSTATGVSGLGGNALSNTIPPLALRGVFRSTNATAAAALVTFTKLIVNTDGSLDVPGTGNTSIFDMVLEPGNPNNLLAAPSGVSTGGGVWRSTNALAATPTFTNTLFPGFNGLVHKMAINKVGAVVTVYITSNETSGTAACVNAGNGGRVRKSIDGGVTWSTPLTAAEGFCGGQCSYDNPLGVDPNNANIVYIGGNARGTCSDVLKRSSDGGTTFTRDDTGLHADAHAISFDPLTNPTTVWFANDGGIWKRGDAAAGTAWLTQNNGPLGTIQFQSLAVHPTDQNFTIGGTQDNGTESQQTTPGNWSSAESGDGGFALIDQSATNTTNVTMYHTFFNQTNNFIGFDRTNLGACLAVKDSWEFRGGGFANDPTPSCDGTAFTLSNGINVADTVLFYAPMALGPGTPNTLYFGTNKLYRSADKGDTMTAVSQTLVAGVAVSAIGISPVSDNVRIVGLVNGSVFATTTGANPLVNATFPTPINATASATNRFISRAVIDPANSNTAYVTLAYYTNPSTAGNIWRTTNLNAGAATWTSIGNSGAGLPNIPVNAFAVDANDPTHPGVSVLYAGTDIGVYRSTDSGATWNPFGTGLPRSSVFDMAIQPTSRILRVATHGRGMWEISLPAAGTGTDTIGLYNPTASAFFLKNSNSAGPGDLVFPYGPAGAGWTPIVGDWDGNGTDTVGLFNPATSTFFLKNSNSAGPGDLVFGYGPAGAGWTPIVGDWDGNGTDTVGLFNPATSTFFLKNSNSAGPGDLVFGYGPAGAGWTPIVGDWDGNGTDTVGLFNPSTSTFFLKNTNSAGPGDLVFGYGPGGAGWTPLVGDWNGDGVDTIGLYNPATGFFFLKNTNAAGPGDLVFGYGPAGAGWKPIVGDWDGL